MKPLTKREQNRAQKVALILQHLQHGPATLDQLAAVLHLNRRAVRPYLAELMHEVYRRVYVSGWAKAPSAPGSPHPLFALGSLPDVPSPAAMTNAEKCLNWKAKAADRRDTLKRDTVAYEISLAKRRALNAPIRRDPLVEALFGKAQQHGNNHEIPGVCYTCRDE